jgi:hypothetical protein
VTGPTSQGLTLAVTLYQCPPLEARISARACEINQARYRAAKSARNATTDELIDRHRFEGCEGCPGVVALAQRHEVSVAARSRVPKPERRERRRKIDPGPDPRGGSAPLRRPVLGQAEASVARKILAAPAPRATKEEESMPEKEFPCVCGLIFNRSQALGKHRLTCPKVTEAYAAKSPNAITRESVTAWERELAQLEEKRSELRRLISAARTLGLVASLALLLTGCDQVARLGDRVFREPCARLCHDFASSDPVRITSPEPICRCSDGSAWRFVGPGAVERVFEDGTAELQVSEGPSPVPTSPLVEAPEER